MRDVGVAISGSQHYADCAVELVGRARLQLALLSYALDAPAYGSREFVDALRDFVLRHERTSVRILVNQPQQAARHCVRLVELGRRISSRFQFRQLDDEDRNVVTEFLVGDRNGVLCKERHDDPEAQWHTDAPLKAQLQLKRFDELWERSPVAREFSELGL